MILKSTPKERKIAEFDSMLDKGTLKKVKTPIDTELEEKAKAKKKKLKIDLTQNNKKFESKGFILPK